MSLEMATIAESLAELARMEGVLAAALVDSNSGMMLGSAGSGIDIELAAAGDTEVVRAKLRTLKSLGLDDAVEDILISLGTQYHVIRPLKKQPGLFAYLVLDRSRTNLALARLAGQDAQERLDNT
jgi:predicted regulator of Ras-like GTPase activity (Roadblock/LC7/MglB family)